MANAGLSAWDSLTLVVYFTLIAAIGAFSSPAPNTRRVRRRLGRFIQACLPTTTPRHDDDHVGGGDSPPAACGPDDDGHGGEDSVGYFLAERSVPFWAVGASLFASNIGSEHFVGLAGTGAASGIAVAWYEWGAMPCVLAMGFFALPIYMASGIFTMPQYLEKRYDARCRTAVVVLSLVLYVFTKISATLFAGQLILEEVSHMDKWLAAVLLIVGTAAYTITGGLSAVIYTEVLQTLVLLVGGFVLLGYGLAEVGGMEALEDELPERFFHLLRPEDDPDFPWTGFVFGYYFVALWYWGCDQVIVQRGLGAKNIAHGQMGAVVAALLKVLPPFLMIFPGMIARVLMEEQGLVPRASEHLQADLETDETWEGYDRGLLDRAYPWLIIQVMPRGLRGLLLAGMMASLMSSLASVFNSSSTLFAMNVYKEVINPRASEARLVWIGRATVVAMAVVSLLWLPLIPALGDQLFIYVQKPPAYTAPPILALFLWGAVSSRPDATGAFATLVVGLVAGMLRFFTELGFELSSEPKDEKNAFLSLNFLHYAAASFAVSTATLFAFSRNSPVMRAIFERSGGGGSRSGAGCYSSVGGKDAVARKAGRGDLSRPETPPREADMTEIELDDGGGGVHRESDDGGGGTRALRRTSSGGGGDEYVRDDEQWRRAQLSAKRLVWRANLYDELMLRSSACPRKTSRAVLLPEGLADSSSSPSPLHEKGGLEGFDMRLSPGQQRRKWHTRGAGLVVLMAFFSLIFHFR